MSQANSWNPGMYYPSSPPVMIQFPDSQDGSANAAAWGRQGTNQGMLLASEAGIQAVEPPGPAWSPSSQDFDRQQRYAQGRSSTGMAGTQLWQERRTGNPNTSRLGFLVAGLCVIIGGLLLAFVYFLAVNSLGHITSTTSTLTGTPSTLTSPAHMPSSSPTAAASPTAMTFPGQRYIDSAQMASAIDKSGNARQVSTTFTINQNIYVTFQLHSMGSSGAVCLLWYLNGKQVTSYSFAIGHYTGPSYSYAIYGATGQGSVELYWASSTACADKLLAQRATFTVS